MACNSQTLKVIDARCDMSRGGIKEVYIANRDVIQTVEVDEVTQEIKTITIADSATFVKWQFRKNTGAYNSSYSSDAAIGTETVTTELTLQFTKAEATKRMAIQAAMVTPSVVIIRDQYDQYIYLGLDNEVTVTAGTMTSGTQTTDLNGFTLTLTDIAGELPHFVMPTVIEGLTIQE